MGNQDVALKSMLGSARFKTYFDAAAGDQDRAVELYLWTSELAGAFHAHLSYVEVGVRNAIDRELRVWNLAEMGTEDWTLDRQTGKDVYELLRRPLFTARDWAAREERERPATHSRIGLGVCHDDVVAQLMFGAWVKLLRPMSVSEGSARQKRLWTAAISRAFPNAPADESGRAVIGRHLERLRRVRNRVAHHDNLLGVDTKKRVRESLVLLAAIDSRYPQYAMARSTLRTIANDDPRLNW